MNVSDEQTPTLESGTEWACVAMSNNYYSEAVLVVITEEKGNKFICEIDWGWP